MPLLCAASSASATSTPMPSSVSSFHRLALDQVFQRLAREALHHDEQPSIVLPNLMDRANIRMIQRRSGPRLSPEALQRLRILRSFLGQKLQGNKTPQRSVFRFIDNSHPTAAQQFHNPVVGNCCSNHRLASGRRLFGGT